MPENAPRPDQRLPRAGVAYALAAYGFWGLVPLYWKPLTHVPPVELTAHRVLWALATYAVMVRSRGRWREVTAALRDRGVRWALVASGALLAVNWGAFIHAVSSARVVEASLGYFISPLVSVALGMTVLRERLRAAQAAALALAVAGVAALAVRAGGVPWIALVLAGSFGVYGLVRKTARVESLAGSAVETLALAPVAAGYLAVLAWRADASFARLGAGEMLLVAGTGPLTAIPLIWFAHAARRLPLTVMGFLQYVGPTLQLAIATLIFREAFTSGHAVGFGLIWAALAVFTADAVKKGRSFGGTLRSHGNDV